MLINEKIGHPKCFQCLSPPVQMHSPTRRNLCHTLTWQDHLNTKHVTNIQIWGLLWAKPQNVWSLFLLALYKYMFVITILNYGSLMNIIIKIICLLKNDSLFQSCKTNTFLWDSRSPQKVGMVMFTSPLL